MEACGTARRHSLPVWLPSFFTSRTNHIPLVLLVVLQAHCESRHASAPANTWRLDVEKMGRTCRPKSLICIHPARAGIFVDRCIKGNAEVLLPASCIANFSGTYPTVRSCLYSTAGMHPERRFASSQDYSALTNTGCRHMPYLRLTTNQVTPGSELRRS